MIRFRFIGIALLSMIISYSLTACSSDDDEIGNVANIYGTWELTHSKGWDSLEDGSDKETWDEDIEGFDSYRYVFDEDGDCEFYTYGGPYYGWRQSTTYDYSIEGNKLYMEKSGGTFVYTIKKLTDTTMILVDNEPYEESDGKHLYHEVMTFVKVDWE